MKKSLFAAIAAAFVGVLSLSLAPPLAAQPPQGAPTDKAGARPPGRAGATPKPGYVVPPENSAGLYPVAGEPIFKQRCAGCHDPAVDRAPAREQLAARTPEEVYDAMTIGAMKPMAAGLSEAQMYGITRYLTGKSPVPQTASAPDPNLCSTHPALQPNGPKWNGWSPTVENLRYQPNPGIRAADVPKLKVKWAFSYPGTKNTEPLIFGDRVYVGSMSGKVYSLDAKTGCVHWRFDYRGGARASMTIGKHPQASQGYVLYVGDDRMVVHALDAATGKELWNRKVNDHIVGRITGSPTLFNNILYIPLSAAEESQGNVASYPCCSFIGTVVAINAIDGKELWTQNVLNGEKAHPTRKNPAGTQMYGPGGGTIWSSVTVDAKRGQLYVATGDSFTEVPHPASDAIVAMDLKTGKIKWTNQVLADDNFVSGTINGPLGKRGPDFDFGSAPSLVKVNGRDMLITGNKSSIVYAMDPDTGKTIWESAKLGSGSASGGVLWGQATDGKVVIAPLADPPGRGRPGVVALEAATGKEIWRYESKARTADNPCSVPSGRCGVNFGQAATIIPGVAFAGQGDGTLFAFDLATGKQVWSLDTALPQDTVNGVKQAPGGSLDMGGPVLAGGMMFMHSGYNGTAGANNLLLAFSVDGK